jgi:hypothetical protein
LGGDQTKKVPIDAHRGSTREASLPTAPATMVPPTAGAVDDNILSEFTHRQRPSKFAFSVSVSGFFLSLLSGAKSTKTMMATSSISMSMPPHTTVTVPMKSSNENAFNVGVFCTVHGHVFARTTKITIAMTTAATINNVQTVTYIDICEGKATTLTYHQQQSPSVTPCTVAIWLAHLRTDGSVLKFSALNAQRCAASATSIRRSDARVVSTRSNCATVRALINVRRRTITQPDDGAGMSLPLTGIQIKHIFLLNCAHTFLQGTGAIRML